MVAGAALVVGDIPLAAVATVEGIEAVEGEDIPLTRRCIGTLRVLTYMVARLEG